MTGTLIAVRDGLRQLGAIDTGLYALKMILEHATRGRVRLVKYHLMAQPVSIGQLLPEHRGRDILVREAGLDDPLLKQAPGRSSETLQARFEAGAHCLIAELDGEFAGFLWLIKGEYAEDEVRCTFRPEPAGASVWDFDVFVSPRHRLSPVFLKLWETANRRLAADGVKFVCSRISAFNPRSRAAHEQLGAERVGRVVFVCVGQWQLKLGGTPPLLHLSLTVSRPLIRVGCEAPKRSSGLFGGHG